MNARGKKARSSSARGGRNKGIERQPSAEGVYSNHRFMQAAGALVGLPIQILTKTKEIFEGIFTTIGPEFDLVLDYPHVISPGDSALIKNPDSIKRKLIFKAPDIVTIRVINVDLEYAFKDSFATDSAISKFNGRVLEKELEPWQEDSTSATDVDLSLEESANGWSADDMFRKNEEAYKVQTTYSPDMDGYTTPLQKKNTKEYKEQEARAQKIASEIEHSPLTQTRAQLENGEDEEEKFSAVVRPDATTSGKYQPEQGNSGKYKPPQRRSVQDRGPAKQQQQQQQQHRGSPSPQSTGGSRYNNHSNNSSSFSSSASGGSSFNSNQMKHPSKSNVSHGPSAQDSKMNGENKDSRRHDNYGRENKSDNYHQSDMNSGGNHHNYQSYHSHGPPPSGPETRRSEPREQREPRKSRSSQKDDSIAELKKFGQDFNLSTGENAPPPSSQDKKNSNTNSHYHQSHAMQHPPPSSQASAHHRDHLQQNREHPRDSQQREHVQREHQQNQHQHPPPTTKHHPPTHASHVSQNVPPTNEAPPQPQQQPSPPAAVPPPSMQQQQSISDTPKEEEKSSVSNYKLNPNAKEFKPFSSRASVTTPPRPNTPQIPTAQSQAIPPMGVVPSVSFQQNMSAYVIPGQQPRYQKRNYVSVGSQRQDYASQLHVAAATGPPILAHAPTPLTPISAAQHLSTVPMQHNMIATQLGQAAQQYQYPSMPMLLRMPMVSVVPTSAAGMYHQGAEGHPSQQHLFMGPNHTGALQPHPSAANPGGPHHPGQPPTPQNHNSAPIPNMPTQPPTPQAIMYGGGGQPTMPQHHVPQSVQHSSQSQYPPGGHNAAALASHHAAPTAQFLMFPPHQLHQMIPQNMPPHSGAGGHIPSSAGYPSTSSGAGMQPMSHTPMHHFTMPGVPPGGHPNQ